MSSLRSIDSNIVQYFPRWRICEPNLQIQFKQAFTLLGKKLAPNAEQNIVVTAAPLEKDAITYDLLLVEVGDQKLFPSEIDAYVGRLADIVSDTTRNYCYQTIPKSIPPSPAQAEAIISFIEPTNVTHSFAISAFEQSIKIGQSGFWLRSILGTDQVGYHFWEAGEAKVVLQRPLYQNTGEDITLRRAIPYLINAHLGAAYRMTGGLEGGILNFLPTRRLNGSPGGKMVAGLDFHMPFMPEAGLSTHLELPFQRLEGLQGVDVRTYAKNSTAGRSDLTVNSSIDNSVYNDNSIIHTAFLLRSTGQVTAFYNYWMNRETNPENYFRLDVGMNYTEVREAAILDDGAQGTYLTATGVDGLETFKPREFGDWIYTKLEYRSQAAYPFGASLQYSNQMLLGRVYLPLFGSWLYLEGKYSTPLRPVRPYEIKNFFMISPILRLNI
ncbi:MAG: hypothetical protein V4642_05820 [Bacteroidota bacterium]